MDIRTSFDIIRSPGYEPAPQQVTRSAGETANPAARVGTDAAPQAKATVPALDLKSAIEAGTKALQSQNQALEFQLDDKSHQQVVKVVDTQTNQVIRQIPSEDFLRMAEGITSFQTHLLRDKA